MRRPLRRFGRRRMTRPRSLTSQWSRISGRPIRGRTRLYPLAPELKKTTAAVSDASIDSGGVIANLFDPGTSATVAGIVGLTCQVRSIYWRCLLTATLPTNAAFVAPTIRVILFVDKAKTTESPTVGGATDTAVLETASILSGLNNGTKGRYQIISDKTFVLNVSQSVPSNDANTNRYNTTMKRFYQLYRRVNFTYAQSATASDPIHNRIYCLYITDVDEVGSIDAQCRISYTDV